MYLHILSIWISVLSLLDQLRLCRKSVTSNHAGSHVHALHLLLIELHLSHHLCSVTLHGLAHHLLHLGNILHLTLRHHLLLLHHLAHGHLLLGRSLHDCSSASLPIVHSVHFQFEFDCLLEL